LTIVSRTADSPHAYAIRAEGPFIGEVEPTARAQGTTVSVSDLYFNTPARRKFLRTEATEFAHCDETFRRITKDSPFMSGIAALYAYESQVPEVAGTKMEGLKKYYGVDSPDGLRFFVVHHSLDVEHSQVTRNMVSRYAETTPDAEATATKAVEDACDALWGFLDGCYREYVEVAA